MASLKGRGRPAKKTAKSPAKSAVAEKGLRRSARNVTKAGKAAESSSATAKKSRFAPKSAKKNAPEVKLATPTKHKVTDEVPVAAAPANSPKMENAKSGGSRAAEHELLNKENQHNNNTEDSDASSGLEPRKPPNCVRCRNHGLKIALRSHKRYCRFRYCNCEKCRLTEDKLKIMALQSAVRRAQALDEQRPLQPGEVRPPLLPDASIVMPLNPTRQENPHLESPAKKQGAPNEPIQSTSKHEFLENRPDKMGFDDDLEALDNTEDSDASSGLKPRKPPNCARCRNHGLKIALKGHKRYCRYGSCHCEKCRLTENNQKVTALKCALRRAQALDEQRSLQLSEVHPPLLPDASIAMPLNPTRQENPHLESPPKKQGEPNEPNKSTSKSLSQQNLIEVSDKIMANYGYPWEMTPLMFTVLELVNGDKDEAVRRIDKSKIAISESPYIKGSILFGGASIRDSRTDQGNTSSKSLMEKCDFIIARYNFPWEMTPLLFTVLELVNGDTDEAVRRIYKSKTAISEYSPLMNSLGMFYGAAMRPIIRTDQDDSDNSMESGKNWRDASVFDDDLEASDNNEDGDASSSK